MIGLDTNILLRWLIDDPQAPEQTALVKSALSGDGPYFVNLIVLAETVWVLKSRARLPRAEIADILRELTDAPQIYIAAKGAVLEATEAFTHGGDFADHLIGAVNRESGCDVTLTFDRKASQSRDFRALEDSIKPGE